MQENRKRLSGPEAERPPPAVGKRRRAPIPRMDVRHSRQRPWKGCWTSCGAATALALKSPEPGGAAEREGAGPPLPSPPLERALEALGERVTATLAGYALDGAPASIPDLIRAARAEGVRIPYPGIDPLPATWGDRAERPARRLKPPIGRERPWQEKRDPKPRIAVPGQARVADERVGPTPETAAKLRRDLVARLAQQGRLGGEQVRAALEIRRVWEAFGRGLFPTVDTTAPIAERRKQALFIDPIDRLTPAEERAWRLRYRPWAREMAVTVAAGAIRTTRLQLILDVVVDNHGLREVEGWYRMRHGGAIEHIRAALHRYAEIAGWVDEPYPETRKSAAIRVNETNEMGQETPDEPDEDEKYHL